MPTSDIYLYVCMYMCWNLTNSNTQANKSNLLKAPVFMYMYTSIQGPRMPVELVKDSTKRIDTVYPCIYIIMCTVEPPIKDTSE